MFLYRFPPLAWLLAMACSSGSVKLDEPGIVGGNTAEDSSAAIDTGGSDDDTGVGGSCTWRPGDTASSDTASSDTGESEDVQDLTWSPGSLAEAAWSSGRRVGAAISASHLSSDPEYQDVFLREFSSWTPENEVKWGWVQGESSEAWDFGDADIITGAAYPAQLDVDRLCHWTRVSNGTAANA